MVDPVRYKPIPIEWDSGPGVFMDDVADGNWVKYEDHKKIVDELKAEIAAAYNHGRVEGWREGYDEGREDG